MGSRVELDEAKVQRTVGAHGGHERVELLVLLSQAVRAHSQYRGKVDERRSRWKRRQAGRETHFIPTTLRLIRSTHDLRPRKSRRTASLLGRPCGSIFFQMLPDPFSYVPPRPSRGWLPSPHHHPALGPRTLVAFSLPTRHLNSGPAPCRPARIRG